MASKRVKSSVILMFISVFSGIIISLVGISKMRLFLVCYGADLNALYQILFQLVSYLSIVDLGIAPVFTAQFYKVVSEENQEKTISLYKGCIFCQRLVIILMIILMVILYTYIILFQSNSFLSKFQMLLSFSLLALPVIAQKTLVANYAYCDALQEKHKYEGYYQFFEIIRTCFNILIISHVTFIYYLLYDCAIEIFIIFLMKCITNKSKKQLFKSLKNDVEKDISPLKNTLAITTNQLCDQGINNTDYQLASQYYTYSQISVLSIYKYVVNIIMSFAIQILYSTKNAFGNLFSLEGNYHEHIVEAFNEFVIFISCFIGVMTFIGIDPIISLISTGSDLQYGITYLNRYFLVLWMVIRIVNIPLKIYSEARGTFRQLMLGKIFELIISLVLMLICLKVFGLFGVFIASIISKLSVEGFNYCKAYHDVDYYWVYLKRIILMIIVLTLSEFSLTIILFKLNLELNTLFSWIVSMSVLSIPCLLILIVLCYVLFENFRIQSKVIVYGIVKLMKGAKK